MSKDDGDFMVLSRGVSLLAIIIQLDPKKDGHRRLSNQPGRTELLFRASRCKILWTRR